jgi:hypothetical protein
LFADAYDLQMQTNDRGEPVADRGSFARVVPTGEGGAVVLMLVLPEATPFDLIEREVGVLEQERQAVRALCEP